MKKLLFLLIFICICNIAWGKSFLQLDSATNSLPDINITNVEAINLKNNVVPQNQPQTKPMIKNISEKKVQQKAFSPKGSGMTNYQYDDNYYKYNKYENFVKDNIDYSMTGKTKIY